MSLLPYSQRPKAGAPATEGRQPKHERRLMTGGAEFDPGPPVYYGTRSHGSVTSSIVADRADIWTPPRHMPRGSTSDSGDTSPSVVSSQFARLALRSPGAPKLKMATVDAPINPTISRDNTAGEDARLADLLAHMGAKTQNRGLRGSNSPNAILHTTSDMLTSWFTELDRHTPGKPGGHRRPLWDDFESAPQYNVPDDAVSIEFSDESDDGWDGESDVDYGADQKMLPLSVISDENKSDSPHRDKSPPSNTYESRGVRYREKTEAALQAAAEYIQRRKPRTTGHYLEPASDSAELPSPKPRHAEVVPSWRPSPSYDFQIRVDEADVVDVSPADSRPPRLQKSFTSPPGTIPMLPLNSSLAPSIRSRFRASSPPPAPPDRVRHSSRSDRRRRGSLGGGRSLRRVIPKIPQLRVVHYDIGEEDLP